MRRQMARDLLWMNSLVSGGRVLHRSPESALMGLRSLLKTARKRHNRYWGQRDPEALPALAQPAEAPPSNSGQSRFDSEGRDL